MIEKAGNLEQLQSFVVNQWAEPSYIMFDHIRVIALAIEEKSLKNTIEKELLAGIIVTLSGLLLEKCNPIIKALEESIELNNQQIKLAISNLNEIINVACCIKSIATCALQGFEDGDQWIATTILKLVLSIQKEKHFLDSICITHKPNNLEAA